MFSISHSSYLHSCSLRGNPLPSGLAENCYSDSVGVQSHLKKIVAHFGADAPVQEAAPQSSMPPPQHSPVYNIAPSAPPLEQKSQSPFSPEYSPQAVSAHVSDATPNNNNADVSVDELLKHFDYDEDGSVQSEGFEDMVQSLAKQRGESRISDSVIVSSFKKLSKGSDSINKGGLRRLVGKINFLQDVGKALESL